MCMIAEWLHAHEQKGLTCRSLTVYFHKQEYGGDEGWPFIEECSYTVLLDSILDEKDNQEQVSQNGDLLEVRSILKAVLLPRYTVTSLK